MDNSLVEKNVGVGDGGSVAKRMRNWRKSRRLKNQIDVLKINLVGVLKNLVGV